MNQEYINNPGQQMFILVAPLDWGLGHATRCIPIIHSLQKYRATVIVAAEGPIAVLLKTEFPDIEIIPLTGYRVVYARKGKTFLWKLARQLPKIQRAINQEYKWLDTLIRTRHLHGVISDNRLGFYSSKIPCIYMTHQLYIETGVSWLNRYVQNLHYKHINRFSECWVPDAKKQPSLAGKLSHPTFYPAVKTQYLGLLSRFKLQEKTHHYDLLIVLSGPEPQRTLFEELLLQQLEDQQWSTIFVRGLPGEETPAFNLPHVTFYNHLSATDLCTAMLESAMVVARAGYSTIMDLAALRKKAILVPTPGQGEQAYLGEYLHDNKIFYTATQQNFNLNDALDKANSFDFQLSGFPLNGHDDIVSTWLQSLRRPTASQ